MYANSMSHWNMAKLEDVNWGVFGKSVDHLVPHNVKEVLGQHLYLSDAVVKQQSEVTNDFTQTMSSKGFGTNSTTLWQEDDSYHLPIKNGSSLMLQGTQSHTSNDVFPIISDLDKTNTCSTLPLEDVSISDYYISESDNPDENRNMLYPTTETSEIESKTLICLESQQKKKDNELNSYDWAKMKIFDDMLSTTISQGEIGNEDEPSWLSSNTMYCSEIASEPGFQYSNYGYDTLIANMEPHFTNANCSLDNMQAVTVNDDEPTHYTFADCSYTDVSSKSNSPIIEKSCNERNKPVQNSKDCSLNGSGADSIKCENMQSSADNGIQISTAQMILNSNFPIQKMDSSTRYQQKKHFLGFSSYMQSSDQNSQLEFNKPIHQVPFTQITSNLNFDEGTNQCTSYENVHCYDKFPDQLYSSQAIAPKNLGTLYKEQNIPHQRKVFEKIDDTKMDGADLQNSLMHYGSKIISCFQQLQNVMKKLDPKTKLCIRESLYRLAKSASQRKDFPTQNCSEAISESKVIRDTKTLQRSEEFMDAETSTNPIDRAVAYLLLHDPAYPCKSTRPADNARALDSKLMEFEDQALFSGCSNMETDLP